MRTGVCSTDFESGRILSADELFRTIRSLGFRCVQFAFSSVAESNFTPDGMIEIPKAVSDDCLRTVASAAEQYELPIEGVNGTFNMAHPDSAVREEGLRRLEILTRASLALGAGFISLCSGTRNARHLWSPSPENEGEDAWRDSVDTMKRAAELAERFGITLAIESEASNVVSTPERARRMMDEVGSSKLKMILDCANLFHAGHAHRSEVDDTIRHAVDVYGKDIVAAHGKDIRDGDGIEFCATGLGIVDFSLTAELLRSVSYPGSMYLHGIYDISDMVRSREHWERAAEGIFEA